MRSIDGSLWLLCVRVAALLGTLVLAAGAASAWAAGESVTVNGHSIGRTFNGVGAISAGASSRLLYDYPEAARSQILDYMFKPGYGASYQILKVEIGGDENSTDGSEASHERAPGQVSCTRGYEWWLMKEAKKRNPDIKLAGLEWGAPGWFHSDPGKPDARHHRFWSQDNIHYIEHWLGCAKQHGLKIDYIGGWNESGFNKQWYKRLNRALAKKYSRVKIVAADDAGPRADGWPVATAMKNDSAFATVVDIVSQHNPCGGRGNAHYRRCPTPEDARSLNKPLWASEFSALSHNVGAHPIARALNRSYIDGRITGQLIWAGISAWYADLPIADTGPILAEWPWSGYYEVGKSVWALAQTTQFTSPGWHYLNTGSERLESGASVVSLASPNSANYSIIVEAMDVEKPITVTFQLENLPSHELQIWTTDLGSNDSVDDFRHSATITPHNNAFQLTLKPGRIYTVSTMSDAVGKGHAHSDARRAGQLRMPFHENFEGYGEGHLARYFSDVNGGFQTEPCSAGRHGMCYGQAVPVEPIYWGGPGKPPTTVAGDPRWWGDYRVSSDMLLEGAGAVELLGRVDGIGGDRIVSGYHLRMDRDGAWRLYSENMGGADTTLASGTIPFKAGSWHHLTLRFQAEEIQAYIDGAKVASVQGNQHRTGQIGLRVDGWQPVQFDNVKVTPNGPWPHFLPHAQMTATARSAHIKNTAGYTYPASAAIDDRPETYWNSEWDPPASTPHVITIDLGGVHQIRALTYRPRLSDNWALKHVGCPITDYVIDVSRDGKRFEKVASGTWPATLAATKVATFHGPHRARYVRLQGAGDRLNCKAGSITASEINISATPIRDPTKYRVERKSVRASHQEGSVAQTKFDPLGRALCADDRRGGGSGGLCLGGPRRKQQYASAFRQGHGHRHTH